MMRMLRKIPRWLVLQTDVGICAVVWCLAWLLRFNFETSELPWQLMLTTLVPVLVVKTAFSLYVRSYAGIIRYTSVEDAKRIFKALTFSLLTFGGVNLIWHGVTDWYPLPVSVLVIDYFIALASLAAFRITAKILYYEWLKGHNAQLRTHVIVCGAGQAGVIAMKTMASEAGSNLRVVAFVDDDSTKWHKTIEGVEILPATRPTLDRLVREKNAGMLVLAMQQISPQRKQLLIDDCLALGLPVRTVPPVQKWINGELSLGQIRDVNIEDVLGRTPILLDKTLLRENIAGKVVLITGAAGSIGSELARQVAPFAPGGLILVDQAESPLYELELELLEKAGKTGFTTVLADITHAGRMESLFRQYHPDLVLHAAAYKHVPVMEENPWEAVHTNVLGTQLLADLAVQYNVEKFVMVSTDKAVNPTSVMGASKRIAEIYIQALNARLAATDSLKRPRTRFVTTRFGNVLGSNGSVIPRFRRQIEQGGPVTITHPDVTRYFMTIPEACQLVLEAGSMGRGGEIFLFDMGESIKIVDLAKKMIRLSGLTLGKDIQLSFTGLRPGEKLYEELLNDQEDTQPTHHPQIMIARVREYSFEAVQEAIQGLTTHLANPDPTVLITRMKAMVPEYVSSNSVFSQLDMGMN